MPIEVKELHIRVVVQDTNEDTTEASLGGDFAVEGDTSRDHKNWVNVTSVNLGGHKPGGGAASHDVPLEEVSFNYGAVTFQHTVSGGDFLFQADANTAGGGRDVLIGGAGADHLEAAASTNNHGRLLVGVDDVRLTAMFDGFDLM